MLLLRHNSRPVRVRATEDIIKIVWRMLQLSCCSLYLARRIFTHFGPVEVQPIRTSRCGWWRSATECRASGCSFSVLSHTCLCSSYLIRLDCMEVMILTLEHKPWSALLCKFLEPTVTFYLIARCLFWNVFLSAQFAKTVSVCFHSNFRDQVKD